MVISLRKWLRSLRYLVVFVVLVYVLGRLFGFAHLWLIPQDPYRYPEGNVVKAGALTEMPDEHMGMLDRLKAFYELGE